MSNPGETVFESSSPDLRNLTSGTTYNIRVRATTDDGKVDLSDWSSKVTAQTIAAPVLSPISNPLKVSSFNIHCANCSTTAEKLWPYRRDTVVAQIKSEMPDVIGLQEASQGWIDDENGNRLNLSQFEDLQRRLVAAGANYKLANDHRNNCENHATPTGCVWKDQGASQGTKILYNADTVEMVDQGSERLAYISEADNQRYAAWGIFKQKSSGNSFFFVDTHIEPSSDTDEYLALKKTQAQRITEIIKEKNPKLPVFIVGDMNSSKYMQPTNGPFDVFESAGYTDPLGNDFGSVYPSGKATAEKRVNAEYNSYNGFTRQLYKNKAVGGNGKHLDYIFTSPMRVAEWKMVLNKDANDIQLGVIPSDHNMVISTVELPASPSPIAIKAFYLNGSLGAVAGSEVRTTTGAYQRYEQGFILWSEATGAYVSTGPIRSAFAASGYETGVLGYPTSDVITETDGSTSQTYQNGAINWSAATGAYATYGDIRARWAATGYQSGKLGFPTGKVVVAVDGHITYQRFQNGYIVYSPATGAHVSMGPIRARWGATGYETGILGFPTGEEVIRLDGAGSYQRYENGFILWSPATGAHVSMGPIRSVWASTGYETGTLGYPTSDVYTTSTGTEQTYERGTISISTLGVKKITYK